MKKMIMILMVAESNMFSNVAQLVRAVRIAKELRFNLGNIFPKNNNPVAKVVHPLPKVVTQEPKAKRVFTQEQADQIRMLSAAGIDYETIAQNIGIRPEEIANILLDFPAPKNMPKQQPKQDIAQDLMHQALRNIENIFYELRDDPDQWSVICKRYRISDEILQQMLDEYAASLASGMRNNDMQAREADDYDQQDSFAAIADLYGLTVDEVQDLLMQYFPEEYQQEPINADDWLAKNRDLPKNQPKENPKQVIRDVQEQNPECIICGNDNLQDDLMYQTICCGGKQFYCPECLNDYEASLKINENSACAQCKTSPLQLRQFDITTGMYTQPAYQAKVNIAAAKERNAQLLRDNQAKSTERRARLHRGAYAPYINFDQAYNQLVNEMQVMDPLGYENAHNAAMRRRSQNPRFDQFVQDVIDERHDGSIMFVANNLLILPTLSNFFDRHFNGRY